MAELTDDEKDAISHRGRAARALAMARRLAADETPATDAVKLRTAGLSVVSNSGLILLKVVAGTLTGSVAILTEAVHSSIDLVASIVAFFSVRKAGEPADESHRYGHEKIENLAAAIEGILILVGSAVIAFEAIRRLIARRPRQIARRSGSRVVAFSIVANLVVSTVIARNARATDSPALEGDAAHLRTDALTSAGVLVGLVLVQITGAQWLDPAVALAVAAAIVVTGVRLLNRSSRVLVDEALPAERGRRDPRRRSRSSGRAASSATTSCARGGRAPAATSTSTSSSAPGPRSRTPTARPTSSRTRSPAARGGPTC